MSNFGKVGLSLTYFVEFRAWSLWILFVSGFDVKEGAMLEGFKGLS